MLLMKKVFFDAIRSGRKTTTLRYWRHQRVRPGQVHTMPGLGKVRIESVEVVDLSSLTGAEADDDGFCSRADLLEALERMYPALAKGGEPGRRAYRVRFTHLGNAGS